MRNRSLGVGFICVAALGLTGCDDDDAPPLGPGDILAVTAPATDGSQKLIGFDRTSPSGLTRSTAITGLDGADRVIAIDQRPADGMLWAMGRSGTAAPRLYTLDTTTGVATAVCTLGTNPTGDRIGLDFNPQPNALRIIGNDGQNLRITAANLMQATPGVAATCTVNTDTALTTGGTARTNITGAAYTNSVSGTVAATQIFYFDPNAGQLAVNDGNPNAGVIANVGTASGPVTAAAGDFSGFDIAGANNVATLAFSPAAATSSTLESLSLVNGTRTLLGTIGGGEKVVGITSRTIP